MDKVYTDILGRELAVGDWVVGTAGSAHQLMIYRVMRFTPMMVRVVRRGAVKPSTKKGVLRYPTELLRINETDLVYYEMTH